MLPFGVAQCDLSKRNILSLLRDTQKVFCVMQKRLRMFHNDVRLAYNSLQRRTVEKFITTWHLALDASVDRPIVAFLSCSRETAHSLRQLIRTT